LLIAFPHGAEDGAQGLTHPKQVLYHCTPPPAQPSFFKWDVMGWRDSGSFMCTGSGWCADEWRQTCTGDYVVVPPSLTVPPYVLSTLALLQHCGHLPVPAG
jgi:hypothetical protein